jgi:hypothetical protein
MLDSQTINVRLSGVFSEFRGFLGFPHCPSCSRSRHEIPIRLIRHRLADPASAKNDKTSHPTTKLFHRLIFLEQSSRNNDSYHPGTARASQMCSSLQRAHAEDLADEVGSFMNVGHRTGGIPSGPFQNGKATNALGLGIITCKKTSWIFGYSTYVQIALRLRDYLFGRGMKRQ